MNDSNWLRAYLVVAILAAILIPAEGVVAFLATATATYVLREIGVDSLPATTAIFIRLGPAGFALIGVASLGAIAGMAAKRHAAIGTLVAAAVLVACICVFLCAILSSQFPFWCITYRLK